MKSMNRGRGARDCPWKCSSEDPATRVAGFSFFFDAMIIQTFATLERGLNADVSNDPKLSMDSVQLYLHGDPDFFSIRRGRRSARLSSKLLFDGRSLHGWAIENDCGVDVVDGCIRLKAGNGWRAAIIPYRDFELHLECRSRFKPTNTTQGIYIRCIIRSGTPFPSQISGQFVGGKGRKHRQRTGSRKPRTDQTRGTGTPSISAPSAIQSPCGSTASPLTASRGV